VLFIERASARRYLYDNPWGRFTAFVAFIGVIQPQLFVRGAYSSTGENNLFFILFLDSRSHFGLGKMKEEA
jgi:hypothetical protein